MWSCIIILSLLSCSKLADSVCMVQKYPTLLPPQIQYICQFQTPDYKTILDQLPIGKSLINLNIINSKIPIITDGTFERFGGKLIALNIMNAQVREIQDRAFRNLTYLTTLTLEGNLLKEVNLNWFNKLPNLKLLNLNRNQIENFDERIFSKIPKLHSFRIRENNLKCLDMNKLSASSKAFDVGIMMNPYKWKCLIEILKWWQKQNHVNISDVKVAIHRKSGLFTVVRQCVEKNSDAEEEEVNACVQKRMIENILKKSFDV